MTKKYKNKNGFTLVEALVAVAIFSIGTTAAVVSVIQTIKLSERVKTQVVAANLAQEGIEIVRNIRDSNWKSSLSWDTNLPSGSGCVQYNRYALDPNCFGGTVLLKFDGNYYSHDGTGTDSIFTRQVSIAYFDDDFSGSAERMLVTSTVTCVTGSCSITLQENLYNWK